MGDSYDRAPAALEQESAGMREAGFVNRVFGWMTVGLAVTGGLAYYMATQQINFILRHQGWFLILALLEFVVVMGLSYGLRHISAAAATAGFLFFAALNGVTLSWIFLAYEIGSVALAFCAASGTFGVMGLFGFLTRRDLTGIGSLCFMGLIGIIIASVINMFWFNRTVDLVISIIGVLIFVGLVAYDTQKIRQLAAVVGEGAVGEEDSRKASILGALQLYLDFINLFLYLLRLFGRRK